MSPFLRSGDLATLEPREGRPVARGDVVAFLVDQRELVIHRVVASGEGTVVTRGDALGHGDAPVAAADLLGFVTSVVRHGRRVHLGLGPERFLIARLSELGWLAPLLRPWRRLSS